MHQVYQSITYIATPISHKINNLRYIFLSISNSKCNNIIISNFCDDLRLQPKNNKHYGPETIHNKIMYNLLMII